MASAAMIRQDELTGLDCPAGIELDHYTITLGTEVKGLDLTRPLTDEVGIFLRRLWLKRKVLFFHEQDITPEQQVALGRWFGKLETFPPDPRNTLEGGPEQLQVFRRGGENVGREDVFHADLPFCDPPIAGTLAMLRAVPRFGGDTLFVDMGAAYRGLSEWLKRGIAGLRAEHRFDIITHFYNRGLPREHTERMMAKFPPRDFPVVQRHPETNEEILYGMLGYTSEILDLERGEGFVLLKLLADQVQRPEYQCRFRWRTNSMALWDNRAVQHYACYDYGDQYRELHRVVILGEQAWPRD